MENEKERIQKKQKVHGPACPSCTKKLFRCHPYGVPTNIQHQQRHQPRTGMNKSFCNGHKQLGPIPPSQQPMPSTYPSLLGRGSSPYRCFPPGWMMMLPPRNHNGFRTNYEEKFRIQQQHAVRPPYYNWLRVPGPPEVISVSDDSAGSGRMKGDEEPIDLNRTPAELEDSKDQEHDSKPARGELDLNVEHEEPDQEDIDLTLKL
ncbi:hypothetical protein ACLOJK_021229 [Asimina triloba]